MYAAWVEDQHLAKLFKAHKTAMNKDPDLEPMNSMKHILRRDNSIADLIESIIEKEMGADEEC